MTEQTYTQKAWSLKDLFEGFDDPNYEATFKKIEAGVEKFEAYRDQLSPELNEEEFVNIITEYEQFFRLAHRLGG
ncbi:MAG: putative M3 family peptidase, partial [Anaerolineaceae bacterium 46_22]